MKLNPIPAFSDNYIWCWAEDSSKAWVVDPGDAAPVVAFLQANNLELGGILITHHHADHIGGVAELTQHYSDVTVVAQPKTCALSTLDPMTDSTELAALGISVTPVPAHTLDHLAYQLEIDGEPTLFCGDALFSAGCGRLFEGSAEQLVEAMAFFKTLSDDTKVCCAHEYTLANLRFAQTVEPNNDVIAQTIINAIELREQSQPTLPTTIAKEKHINPFLRIDRAEVQQSVRENADSPLTTEAQLMAALRKWKDVF